MTRIENKDREITWENLTPEELETLSRLVSSGKTVFAAPIEIESDEQLESLGITRAQCRTWHVGSVSVTVHLTPADEETYDFLLEDIRQKYRHASRRNRCLIPGTQQPLIMCPECNKCAECPFPDYRGLFTAAPLSLDVLVDSGCDVPSTASGFDQLENRDELYAVCRKIRAVNPKYLRAIVLRDYYGLSVKEVAEEMQETVRNVYFYIDQARKIGRQIKS